MAAALCVAGAAKLASEEPWSPVGPAGGDARALAAVPGHPDHLYLGTTGSWLYDSLDGGASWRRLSKVDGSDELILDHILFDPRNPATMYVAAWQADRPNGGLWISHDGGRSWDVADGLRGQSIRAFAQAPSDPSILFAGTLEGVFRSRDAGVSWTEISPPGSHEIHEVESLAIDPQNPEIVYAGTWHLPWKTTDGGKSWQSIKKGVIDDSDVFSILVDPVEPRKVFASACSGIYKSEDGAELFHKIAGIPATARRTRVLKQDPAHREVVYAGTTEGLYKTMDGGRNFRRMTGPDVIVNDVFVDPRDSNHVLLATDRGGVLASRDAGASFVSSNEGFSARKVEALLVDRENPMRVFAGVVNDKIYGGVFASLDGGATWSQMGEGLDGRDVFALAQARDGTVLAGTSHGIFALQQGAPPEGKAASASIRPGPRETPESEDPASKYLWAPRNVIANTSWKPSTETHLGKRINVEKRVKDPVCEIASRVYALDLSGDAWLASTGGGLLTSRDSGTTWQGGPVMGAVDYLSVAVHGKTEAAVRPKGVVVSADAGLTWMPLSIPEQLTGIHSVAFSPDGTLWLGAREGVYFTRNLGKTWLWIERLPFRNVDDLYYAAELGQVLVSSRISDQIFAIDPQSLSWKWWKTGYRLTLVRAAGGRLLAASLDDGVLVGPRETPVETGQK